MKIRLTGFSKRVEKGADTSRWGTGTTGRDDQQFGGSFEEPVELQVKILHLAFESVSSVVKQGI